MISSNLAAEDLAASLRLGGIMLCDFYLSTEAMEFTEREDPRDAWIPTDHCRHLILPFAATRLATFERSLVRSIQRMVERDSSSRTGRYTPRRIHWITRAGRQETKETIPKE